MDKEGPQRSAVFGSWIRSRGRKLAARVNDLLSSGITPQKLALTVALGACVGVMPVLWGTSLVCALLAAKLRLNHGAVQVVNYLCYPLQIALFIPFCRLGQTLFNWGPKASTALLSQALHGHLGATVSLVGWATLRGVGAWLVTAPPLAAMLYPFLKWMFLRRRLRESGGRG